MVGEVGGKSHNNCWIYMQTIAGKPHVLRNAISPQEFAIHFLITSSIGV
jgi:hypothetical protein